jgi:hypothetical protein
LSWYACTSGGPYAHLARQFSFVDAWPLMSRGSPVSSTAEYRLVGKEWKHDTSVNPAA